MFHHDWFHTGDFSYRGEANVTELVPASPVSDRICDGCVNNYFFRNDSGGSFVLRVTPVSRIEELVIDGAVGGLPHFIYSGEYTCDSETVRGVYELGFSPSYEKGYYFSVYGKAVGCPAGEYRIAIYYEDEYLSDFEPDSAPNSGVMTIGVSGVGLDGVELVKLERGSVSVVSDWICVISGSELVLGMDLRGVEPGEYDFCMCWGDGHEELLPGAFRIYGGPGRELLGVYLDVSDSVSRGDEHTLWVTYSNEGDEDIALPLLEIESNAMMYVGDEVEGSDVIQVLVPGGDCGRSLLRVGESGRIPICFTAPDVGDLRFTVSVVEDTDTPIDWEVQKGRMKPRYMSDEEWDEYFPYLTELLGGSWSAYQESLRETSLRFRRRGVLVYDVGDLLDERLKELLGRPLAAVYGRLRDFETGELLSGVSVKAVSRDGLVSRSSVSRYEPEGVFVIEGLEDGEYDLYMEGYYFDGSLSVEVLDQRDVGVGDLEVFRVDCDGGDGFSLGVSDHAPVLACDGAGVVYAVWERGSELYSAVYDDGGWGDVQGLPGAEGCRPELVLEGERIYCFWETRAVPERLYLSCGVVGGGEITWFSPVSMTGDAYDDFSVSAVSSGDEVLMVWLQRDMSREDDTDLYYKIVEDVGYRVEDAFSGNSGGFSSFGVDGVSVNFSMLFGEIPCSVPIIGGGYGFTVGGEFGVSDLDCSPRVSGDAGFEVVLGSCFRYEDAVGFEAGWLVDPEGCRYFFDEASTDFTVFGDVVSPLSGIPLFFPVDPPFPVGCMYGEVRLAGGISGDLQWSSNFPFRPDGGDVRMALDGVFDGRYRLFGEVYGVLDGDISVVCDDAVSSGGIVFDRADVRITGNFRMLDDHVCGVFTKNWSYPSSFSGGGHAADVYEFYKCPFLGTGEAYEGGTVLGDISGDVSNDRFPCLYRSMDGRIYLVWSRSAGELVLGSRICMVSYDGEFWGDMVYVTPEPDFNYTPVMVDLVSGDKLFVWSSASGDGLDYYNSSVEEIVGAMLDTDMMYRIRHLDGSWEPLGVIGEVEGCDEGPVIALNRVSQEVMVVWKNYGEGGYRLYYSRFLDTGWTSPAVLVSSPLIYELSLTSFGDGFLVVWSQDGDGDSSTFEDSDIFFSIWSGGFWSGSEELKIEDGGDCFGGSVGDCGENFCFEPPGYCCRESGDPGSPDAPECQEMPKDTVRLELFDFSESREKRGSVGLTGYHLVFPGERMCYVIYFENRGEIPVREISVDDYLDYGLDVSTLRIEEVSIGDNFVVNGDGDGYFERRIRIEDNRSGLDRFWYVEMVSGIDVSMRRLHVLIRTIDPETGRLPSGVDVGCLPVEDGTGCGRGYIRFSIRCESELGSWRELSNFAWIRFDSGSEMKTNTWVNYIGPEIGSGVYLYMPSEEYHPGDECYLYAYLMNRSSTIPLAYLYVLLEIDGGYWFYPSWISLDEGTDCEEVVLRSGLTGKTIIPAFTWPDVRYAEEDMKFHGLLLDKNRSNVIGDVSTVKFGCGY
jgi:hypothetical protein